MAKGTIVSKVGCSGIVGSFGNGNGIPDTLLSQQSEDGNEPMDSTRE
jgi:hypothetical protein